MSTNGPSDLVAFLERYAFGPLLTPVWSQNGLIPKGAMSGLKTGRNLVFEPSLYASGLQLGAKDCHGPNRRPAARFGPRLSPIQW